MSSTETTTEDGPARAREMKAGFAQAAAERQLEELRAYVEALEVEVAAQGVTTEWFDPALFEPTSLNTSVLEGIGIEDFARLMLQLDRLHTGIQFWLGDAMLWGEEHFEDEVWGVITSSRKFKTLLNYRRICELLPPSHRHDQLLWSLQRVVAENITQKKERERLMAKAWRNDWTYRQTEQAARNLRWRLENPEAADRVPALSDPGVRSSGPNAPVVPEAKTVWVIRVTSDEDEGSKVGDIVQRLYRKAEAEIEEAGLATAQVEVLYN